MTITEANELLDAAEPSDKPSKLNPGITRSQAVDIVRKGLNAGGRALLADGVTLEPLYEKRVLQVTRNQRRPKF